MKKTMLGLGSLALVLGVAGMFAGTVSAYRGDPSVTGPNYSAERHEAMEKAFENKDYSAWKELMGGRGRVTEVVNESNFAKFAEAHELMEQGKFDEGYKIRQELGLASGSGRGFGGMGRGGCLGR